MKIINESEVELEHRLSPGETFELKRRHVSLALGGAKDKGTWGGGFPFDVELATLPPGKKNYPYHAHAAQWEQYIFVSGTGRLLNQNREWISVRKGDHVLCPPGRAHQIHNNTEEPLVYYVISDHPRADVTTYPNTGKRHLKPDYLVCRVEETDYYEGEES